MKIEDCKLNICGCRFAPCLFEFKKNLDKLRPSGLYCPYLLGCPDLGESRA
ncbi:hypothetical protein D1BOALGB6SA_8661 [Olavius sp. associated proteobacterium Delta 1]|nr:hypothetical protein D1BOALGB6SA_8661 [Olavius sp. associated proteobacterium Delta 1]